MPDPKLSHRRLAIDGPAASGKSSVGGAVAASLGLPFIDTGLIYRALTWLALSRQIDLRDESALTDLAATARIELGPAAEVGGSLTIEGLDATRHLRSPRVEQAVSTVSAAPGVRRHLIALQRSLAGDGAVMAGRDIGSVVLPDAELKVYLDASPEARAQRRLRELQNEGVAANYADLVEQMRRRDMQDSTRAVAPLRAARDAIRLITDDLSLEDSIRRVVWLAYERWPDLLPASSHPPDAQPRP